MLIADVHAKWTAGSPAEPLTSGARFFSRHCKGAPATLFPPLQMTSDQCHHQPHQLLRSGRILAKQAKPVGRPAVDWNLVVLKSALRQSKYKVLRHFSALRYDQFNSLF
jgi:hypothetical protein